MDYPDCDDCDCYDSSYFSERLHVFSHADGRTACFELVVSGCDTYTSTPVIIWPLQGPDTAKSPCHCWPLQSSSNWGVFPRSEDPLSFHWTFYIIIIYHSSIYHCLCHHGKAVMGHVTVPSTGSSIISLFLQKPSLTVIFSFSQHLHSDAACHDEICNTCRIPILRRQMGVLTDQKPSILIRKSCEHHQMMGWFQWRKSVRKHRMNISILGILSN